MRANYHTHTHFCNHARGTASEYVKSAIDANLEVIGISDHAPNPMIQDVNVRMRPNQLMDYLDEIDIAIKEYGTQIKILKGLEVEFFEGHDDYFINLRNHVEYLILGQHYISKTNDLNNLISGFALGTKDEIYAYSDYLVKAMESNYFDILAHPDLYMCGYKDFDEHAVKVAHRICKKAEETNTILEFNANGYRRGLHDTPQGKRPSYPRIEFWDIVKQYNIKTIISSDCHTPDFIYDETIKKAEETYKSFNTQNIDFITLKKL